MERIKRSGMTLNNKWEFSMTSTKFLGFIIDEGGIHADPSKVAAISKFPVPQNVTELQRFLGMVNQMGRFAPQLDLLDQSTQIVTPQGRDVDVGHSPAECHGKHQERTVRNTDVGMV